MRQMPCLISELKVRYSQDTIQPRLLSALLKAMGIISDGRSNSFHIHTHLWQQGRPHGVVSGPGKLAGCLLGAREY